MHDRLGWTGSERASPRPNGRARLSPDSLVFDSFRKSLEDLINRATPPEERREIAAQMRDTLVQAKVGLADLRDALAKAKDRLSREERELETMRRRKKLAADVKDAETGALAEKYEQIHAERVAVLVKKVAAQEEELLLAERDVEAMSTELRAALAGGPAGGAVGGGARPQVATGDDLDLGDSKLAEELDALGRARARAEREADADRKLDELKRRMGK
jgi:hypothetical protein